MPHGGSQASGKFTALETPPHAEFVSQTLPTLGAERNLMTWEDKESQRTGFLPLTTTDVNLWADTRPQKINPNPNPKEPDSGQVGFDVQRRKKMSTFHRWS